MGRRGKQDRRHSRRVEGLVGKLVEAHTDAHVSFFSRLSFDVPTLNANSLNSALTCYMSVM